MSLERYAGITKIILRHYCTYALVRHLDEAIVSLLVKKPELCSAFVPEDYCGEFLEEDISHLSSEDVKEAYRRGYKRGLERFTDFSPE